MATDEAWEGMAEFHEEYLDEKYGDKLDQKDLITLKKAGDLMWRQYGKNLEERHTVQGQIVTPVQTMGFEAVDPFSMLMEVDNSENIGDEKVDTLYKLTLERFEGDYDGELLSNAIHDTLSMPSDDELNKFGIGADFNNY